MILIHDKPKFWWLLKLFFPKAKWDEGVILTYGDKVYCKFDLGDELIAHEQVHVKQQKGRSKILWFLRYWASSKFRLSSEIPAHRAEYKAHSGNEKSRLVYLNFVASRLSGPLYKNMITLEEAKKLIIK